MVALAAGFNQFTRSGGAGASYLLAEGTSSTVSSL
jgi:hypothetical protein